MPHARDIPLTPLFFHPVRLVPETPFLHTASTEELDPPYRTSRSLVVHLGRGYGIVLGRWRRTGRTAEEALLTATRGREDAMSQEHIRETKRFDEVPDCVLENFYDVHL
jgi:hypothetical protein